MAPKRIILACESLVAGNGGIARVDRLMARVLTERGAGFAPEFHVFCDGASRAAESAAALGAPVRGYGGSRLRFSLGLWRAMFRPGGVIYDAAYYAKIHRFSPLAARRPCLIFLHGIEIWERARRGSVAACRRAGRLVANSAYTRDRAERCHGGFARAGVCWLGTETAEPGTPSVAPSGPPVVLVVGRMEAREGYKGHRELIAAWPEVLARQPEARLRIVGRGGQVPELVRLAAERGVTQRVEFTGWMPEEKLADCYRTATAFALPSRGEGFGLVYIEAMRHGLPVVASVHDAAREIVEDGRTGLLADLDRPGDLAEKIARLLARPDEARRMGQAGQERWREHFTFAAFRGRFRGVLEGLAEEQRAQRA
ncbi:MAG: glycosyltransferase family 4 protein [Opitutaceae bacterium]|nr:glycosyltransferase family 4 protein [Opitutaceae bacterium]